MAPGPASGAKALHEPSGVGVSPLRTLRARLVPAGVSPVHDAWSQAPAPPPSKTRDSNVPVYCFDWSQSTDTFAPPTPKSLTIACIVDAMVAACDATRLPSMKKSTPVVFQLIR